MGAGRCYSDGELLAAYRARMAVQQGPPTDKETLEARIAAEFLNHCKALKVAAQGRTGSALWNLTTDMRKDATGIYALAFSKVAPGGKLPSGQSHADAMKRMRQELFKRRCDEKEAESRKKAEREKRQHVGMRVFTDKGWGKVLSTKVTNKKATVRFDLQADGKKPKDQEFSQDDIKKFVEAAKGLKDPVPPVLPPRKELVSEEMPDAWTDVFFHIWQAHGPLSAKPDPLWMETVSSGPAPLVPSVASSGRPDGRRAMRTTARNEVVQDREELRAHKKRILTQCAADSSYASKCLEFEMTSNRLQMLLTHLPAGEAKQKALDDLMKHLQAGQPEAPTPIVAPKTPPPAPKKARTEDETTKENDA
jgi:hypothetical protein